MRAMSFPLKKHPYLRRPSIFRGNLSDNFTEIPEILNKCEFYEGDDLENHKFIYKSANQKLRFYSRSSES